MSLELSPLSRHQPAQSLVLVVACVLVDSAGRVLIGQRPEGKSDAGLWEFPGGKIESGECPEEALIRELREELGIDVDPIDLQPLTFASRALSDAVGGAHLLMPVFVCRMWKGVPKALEHVCIEWILPQNLYERAMPQADLPLLPVLVERL
ncbi:MAG TPA: (deoxy)nucleoside triphosphate pyrophosphohydrolase [Alphaproteobacteria bacterium]|nr:(deoxy)nucleoside triphosphate pyrophosphohydrolase [Alphaproteobacteria bacterium]